MRTQNSAPRPSIISLPTIRSFVSTILGGTIPQKEIKYLLDKKDFQQWEIFRDNLVDRWSNANVVVGALQVPLKNTVVDQSIFSVV